MLNTDPSTVETGCLPCKKLIGVDVVDSIGAAELPITSPDIQENFVCPVADSGLA